MSVVTCHSLRADLPVALDVPETQGTCGRRYRLSKAEVGVLQERELKLVVLADRDERSGSIQALAKNTPV